MKAYFENVESLAKGEEIKGMDEWEAAKKLGVGTITGSYNQKVLNLKNLKLPTYRNIRDHFIMAIKDIKLIPGTDQEPSDTLKQTFKEIFLEEKFIDGLIECDSQFDLIESLPVIGLPLKVKRSLKISEDPWQIEVQGISKELKGINSLELFHKDYKLAWKPAEGEKLDYVNCVLPLFGPKEEDMLPLIKDRLFHLLMTFVVSQTADALYEDAYLSLLGNTLIYLMDQAKSEWQEILWKRTLMAAIMVYYNTAQFDVYWESMLKTPELAVQDSSDLSKPFIHLLIMKNLDKVSDSDADKIIQHMFIKFFSSFVEDKKFLDFLKISGNAIIDKLKEDTVNDFNKFNTLGELKRSVDGRLEKVAKEIHVCAVTMNIPKLEKVEQKITIKNLNSIYNMILKKTPTNDDYLYWLIGAIKNKGKKFNPEKKDMNIIQAYFFGLFKDNIIKSNSSNIYSDLKEGFMKKFREEHMYLTPISITRLKELADLHGIDINSYTYNKDLNLVKNACMCPKCPFFIKPQERLIYHLSTWSEKCPKAFHKTVKHNLDLSPDIILEKVLKGELARDKNSKKAMLNDFDSNKDEALTYIKLLKEEYKRVIAEEAEYTGEMKVIEHNISKVSGIYHHHKEKKGGKPKAKGKKHR